MKAKFLKLTLFFLFIFSVCLAEGEPKSAAENGIMGSLILPAIIAVIGYVLKSGYDVVLDWEKRNRTMLEEKLKNFYWPIQTRLEENNAIWKLILSKREERNELEKKIGVYVEENIVLKNHREIMGIIINYRYLAKFDPELTAMMNEYFRHVAIYEGILQSKENTFPGLMGAPYPTKFDDIIRDRTEKLQKQLDKKMLL